VHSKEIWRIPKRLRCGVDRFLQMLSVDALHHFSVKNGFKSEDFFDHFSFVELNG